MPQAKVLRLLRYDAKSWWYFAQLRKQGRIIEAVKLERQSIRDSVKTIRQNIGREAITYRTDCIQFPIFNSGRRPFDLKPYGVDSYTTSISGCHPGFFAAWVHCYAFRIGWCPTAKQFDTI